MTEQTIHLYDAELLGMAIGVIVECDSAQLGHWPCSMDEAEERAREEWPGAAVRRHERAG